MSFVRTILGDIPPEALGVCYAHEHVIIDPSFATEVDPSFLIDDVDRAIAELRECRAVGVRAMIDTMPGGAGRNANKLAAVSEASGIHIVCPTGMHLAKYYREDDPLLKLDMDALAEWFIGEIEVGVRECDSTADRPRRAGVIKIASGRNRLSEHETKVFAAAAIAHRATGCPIITHTEAGTAAHEQVDRLEAGGVDLSRVTLSHMDRLPDIELHRSLLKRGVNLEYDSCFRWKADGPNHSLNLLVALIDDFGGQLMLGMDAARRRYWRSYDGEPGLSFLYGAFVGRLRAEGFDASAIRSLFVDNPSRAYAFEAKGEDRDAAEETRARS